MRWYCVYTKQRAEIWARSNLWERGFEVYLPEYHKRRCHARRIDWVRAPLFPRYLFIRADLEERGAHSIVYAPGVQSLVSFSGPPALVPDSVISEMRTHEDTDGLIDIDFGQGAASRFIQGERVRVNRGALLDQVGVFQCREDDHRVVILLKMLGRTVRTRIAADTLEGEGRASR